MNVAGAQSLSDYLATWCEIVGGKNSTCSLSLIRHDLDFASARIRRPNSILFPWSFWFMLKKDVTLVSSGGVSEDFAGN